MALSPGPVDPLPPRTGRHTSSTAIASSSSSSSTCSASSASSSAASASRATAADRRHWLHHRVLELDDYRQEIAEGHKYARSDCLQRWGTTIAPVPVPLARGQTLGDYERAFVTWLQENQGKTIAQLRPTPSLERTLRFRYAIELARNGSVPRSRPSTRRGVGASRTPSPSPLREDPDDLLQRRVLSVAEYHQEMETKSKFTQDESLARFGTPVMPIPVPLDPCETVATYETRFQGWLASRNVATDELARDPSRERSLRIAFAKIKTQGYIAGAVAPDRPTIRRGRGGSVLLQRRVLPIAEHLRELRERVKLSEDERLELFGTLTVPIPVPLAPGQPERDYERRFEEWLAEKDVCLADLSDDENKERSYRITFALHTANAYASASGGAKNAPAPTEPSLIVGVKRPRSAADALADDGGGFKISLTSEGRAVRRAASPSPTPTPAPAPARSPPPIAAPLVAPLPTKKPVATTMEPKLEVTERDEETAWSFPRRCALQCSEPSSGSTPDLAAFVDCGCRRCLLTCTSHLIARVADLEAAASSRRTPPPSSSARCTIADLTKESDSPKAIKVEAAGSSSATTVTGGDAAALLPPGLDAVDVDDPIESQLMREYDEINDGIQANELALRAAVERLQEMAVEDIKETAKRQEENQVLRSFIQEEKENRNAAAAMVIVYLWRASDGDLEQRLAAANKANANIAHIQTACHRNCAEQSAALTRKRASAEELKRQLDERLGMAMGSLDEHLTAIEGLGAALTAAERDIRGLVARRRREFATLIHFDAHIRQLVRTLLEQAD